MKKTPRLAKGKSAVNCNHCRCCEKLVRKPIAVMVSIKPCSRYTVAIVASFYIEQTAPRLWYKRTTVRHMIEVSTPLNEVSNGDTYKERAVLITVAEQIVKGLLCVFIIL